MMDEPTLKELQNEIRHMDEPELLAFGRKHQSAHNFMNKTPTGIRCAYHRVTRIQFQG
jgi:hypothetical protein